MELFYSDFDKRFLSALREQKNETITVDRDEFEEVQRKARLFDVLIAASKREVEAMWDFMNATGARPEPLINELAEKQRTKGAA